ncbi:MAG: SAM-dependent methyltransferase [Betaproteobacteria bacterium]|nr:SAM-dependent methyltransferase [Betaproteobacteria bacterium]MBA3775790.1 SAM-dependent methyltransferase [Betaproteobacteria bacterium]
MLEPEPRAREHSARVVRAIRAEIERADGFVTFARYMQLALYAPALGYYVAGTRKFGASGDFVTAPELTPLFAQALAAQVEHILSASVEREILELGAGSGALAVDLLEALAARRARPARYRILEVSPELRERQRASIAQRAAAHLPRVEWLVELPAEIDGVVLLNEVLDAVPPHLIARRSDRWYERGVTWAGDRFAWSERPLRDARLRTLAAARFPDVGDFVSELNPAAESLVEELGRKLGAGSLIISDYGFPQHEFYHAQRSEGTLLGHYRHHVHADPFLWPGLSDLTAHVDFTAIAAAGERVGLNVTGYTSQAAFLLGCGILDRLHETGDPTSIAYLRAAAAVQILLSPAEMGELCKVLVLARENEKKDQNKDGKKDNERNRDGTLAGPGFALGDRSHRL